MGRGGNGRFPADAAETHRRYQFLHRNRVIRVRVIRLHAIAYGLVRADLLPVPLLYPLMNQHLKILSFSLAAVFSASAVADDKPVKLKKKAAIKVAAVKPETIRPASAPQPGFPPSVTAGWTLRDEEGREMQANLLSAHGDMVKIQRIEDAREFDVPISMFDSNTENLIRDWIEEDPEAVDYAIDVKASRELVDSSEFDLAGRSFKRSEWSYKVTLSNKTRNDLTDAQVEYRIVFDDNVSMLRTTPMPGKGVNQQDGQAVDLPDMIFNDEIEFDTPTVETQTYEYKPTKGQRDYLRDEIKGIWIRVVRHGEVIAEYKSNEAAMKDLSWDNEDKVEIRITNKFRDSFEDSDDEVGE